MLLSLTLLGPGLMRAEEEWLTRAHEQQREFFERLLDQQEAELNGRVIPDTRRRTERAKSAPESAPREGAGGGTETARAPAVWNLPPPREVPFIKLAEARRRERDWTDAIAAYDRAIEIEPKAPPLYLARGIAKWAGGDLPGALADSDYAIDHGVRRAFAYRVCGRVHYQRGDWSEARADLQRACAFEPGGLSSDYDQLVIWLALERMGQGETADRQLAAYLEHRQPAAEAYIVAKYLLGRTSEADYVEEAVALDRDGGEGQEQRTWFFIGMKALLAGDRPAAERYFRKIVEAKGSGYLTECAVIELRTMQRP